VWKEPHLLTLLGLFCSNPGYIQPFENSSYLLTSLSVMESSPRYFQQTMPEEHLCQIRISRAKLFKSCFISSYVVPACQLLSITKHKSTIYSIISGYYSRLTESICKQIILRQTQLHYTNFLLARATLCRVTKHPLPMLSTRNEIIWVLCAISLSSNNPKRSEREYNTCETKVRPRADQLLIQHETEVFGSLMLWLC